MQRMVRRWLLSLLKIVFLLSFNVFLLVPVSLQATELKKIVLGTTNAVDTPLYQKAKRILTHAFSQLGYKLSIENLPNKRSLIWANSGELDGELFRISDLNLAKLPNLQRVDEALFLIDQSVIGKEGIQVNGWQSMSNYVVAYERGTKFIEVNQDKFKGVILVNTFHQAISLIYSGRADITITSWENGKKSLAKVKHNKGLIKVHRPPLLEIELHVYLNKVKHPKLAYKLSKLLQRMKLEGLFNELLNSK